MGHHYDAHNPFYPRSSAHRQIHGEHNIHMDFEDSFASEYNKQREGVDYNPSQEWRIKGVHVRSYSEIEGNRRRFSSEMDDKKEGETSRRPSVLYDNKQLSTHTFGRFGV